ncbi:MAG: hypothetical protein ABFS05_03500, partial [Bacteroidota bacterium]
WRHWYLYIIAMVISAGSAYYFLNNKIPTYEVAATILILIAVFFRFDPFVVSPSNSDREARIAFEEASRVLYFVSDKFSKGATPLKKVARFDQGINDLNSVKKFDEGVEKATPLSRFKQITDLITNPAP